MTLFTYKVANGRDFGEARHTMNDTNRQMVVEGGTVEGILEAVRNPTISTELSEIAKAGELAQGCMALICAGLSYRAAGRLLNVDPATVHYWVAQLDPERKVRLTPHAIRIVQAAIIASKATAALTWIDDDKLKQSDAKDLMNMGLKGIAAAHDLLAGRRPDADGEEALNALRRRA